MVESKQLELLDLADKLEVTLVGMEEVEATDVLDQLARYRYNYLAEKLEVTLVGIEEVEATDVLDQLARYKYTYLADEMEATDVFEYLSDMNMLILLIN